MRKNRDWSWKYAPYGREDAGANDEGYYYFFCSACNRRTEHETGYCCKCHEYNDPDYWS